MRIHIHQIFVKHVYRSLPVHVEVRRLVLYKKLRFVPGAILNKLGGMPMEGIGGPGMSYGMAMAEMVSRKETTVDLVENTNSARQPATPSFAELAS